MNRPMMSRTVIMSRMDLQDRGALGHLETLRRESIREHNENLSGRPKIGVEEGGTPGCVATIVRLLGPNFLNMPGFWLG